MDGEGQRAPIARKDGGGRSLPGTLLFSGAPARLLFLETVSFRGKHAVIYLSPDEHVTALPANPGFLETARDEGV